MPESAIGFWTQYSHLCLKAKTCPSSNVIKYLKGTELCCPVEAFRSEHWKLLLSALSVDNSLTKVHFGSFSLPASSEEEQLKKVRKRKSDKNFGIPYGRTEQNISSICWSLGQLLKTSESIVVLKLESLSLKNEDVDHLAEGLKSSVVKQLSLAGSVLTDTAVEVVCQNLQSSDISWVDFSSCNLNRKGVTALCNLIKAHKLRRSSNEMFKETLRYRIPVLDAMKGLSRVSLNNNFLKDGINILVESLEDDSWIKALDLQKCAIDNEGAKGLLSLSKFNGQLEIIDLRLNDIDDTILNRISQQLRLNKTGKTTIYEMLPLWTPPRMKRKMPKFITNRKGMFLKKSSPPKLKLSKKLKSNIGTTKTSLSTQNKSISTVDVSSQTMSDSESSKVPSNVLEIMNKLKVSLTKEIELRRYFMQRLEISTAENIHLREELAKYTTREDLVLIDIETYLEVKRTFEKFKRFLNIMKDYGLWEFVKMLGVNEDADIVLRLNPDSEKHMKIVEPKTEYTAEPCSYSASSRHLKFNAENKLNTCCCNCRKLGCKLSENSHLKTEEKVLVRTCKNGKSDMSSVDKASVQRVFKEVRSNCIKESMANPQSDVKKSSSNKQSGTVHANSSGKVASKGHVFIKKIPISSVPSKLRELNSPTQFYEIVRTELEECDRQFYSENVSAAAFQNTSSSYNSNKSLNGLNNRSVQTKLSSSPDSAKLPVASDFHFFRESTKQASDKKISPEKRSKADFRLNSINNTDTCDKLPTCSHSIHRCVKNDIDSSSSDRSRRNKSLLKSKSKLKSRSKKVFHSDSQSDAPISDHSYALPSYTSFHPESQLSSRTSQKSVTLKNSESGLVNSKETQHANPSDERTASESSVTSYEHSLSVNKSSSKSSVASDKLERLTNTKGSQNVSKKAYVFKNDHHESKVQKSYIESVSDASTDKDVKSLSEEVVSNVSSRSKSSSKHSENEGKKEHSIELLNQKQLSSHSEVKGIKYQSDHKASSASLKRKDLENSSVPSLSDITTVSSGSLNTDLVMNQLSGSDLEKE